MGLDRRFEEILAAMPTDLTAGREIGRSREGRAIRAFRFGSAGRRISVLGGCHADEPVGPRTLRHLCSHLADIPEDDPLLDGCEWWIVPHINPDGAERNRSWQPPDADAYDPTDYLLGSAREVPGDDIEFGFPRDPDDAGARPENRAVYDWWRTADGPFDLHLSLHGMAFAAGPWYLIEAAWRDRCERLKRCCREQAHALGYVLHDVERQGAKGFFRLERGFCTRPDSRCMRQHFLERGEPETAALFRPSSMETIRGLGGDALTLVSEMPLFITPGVGETLGPPDPAAERWRAWIAGWRGTLLSGGDGEAVASQVAARGLYAMPVRDQMRLQLGFLFAGMEQVGAA